MKEVIFKVRTFFEMEKNAGKIRMTIDKPRESTAAALGVSLRTVNRVYLESQATGVQLYHSKHTHTIYKLN